MKHYKSYLILLAFVIAIFPSCDDEDEVAMPVITMNELGYEDSKTAFQGSDLHIDADIEAEGKVDKIKITIHPEGEHKSARSIKFPGSSTRESNGLTGEAEASSTDPNQLLSETDQMLHEHEWEFDSTYTGPEFAGVVNPHFHKHVEIPVYADTGHYHFHFVVTDMEGNQAEFEEEIAIKQPEDTEKPVITVNSAPSDGEVFSTGDIISISGEVKDNLALGGIYVGLVRENQNLEDAEVNAMNTITLLHTHDFDDPKVYAFDASIEVGVTQDNNPSPSDLTKDLDGGDAWQSGDYYLIVKSPDKFGGGVAFSDHYKIKLEN